MKVLFSALLVLNLLGECLGSGYVDVQAVIFENPHGKDKDGKNCEFWPTDHCDHKFTFCLLSGGSCTTSFHTGTYWDSFLVDFGNPMAGGSANPMRFHFQDEYPGQFSIRAVVVDDDRKSSSDDPVDIITISRTMSPGGNTVEVKQPGSRSSFTTHLTLRFTVRCDTNYYGERCNVYCRATDSESGHYTCGSSGEKVCLEGWTNPTQHCLTPVCRVGCDHGRCDRPGECICTEGYGGSLCNEPVCEGGCGHGTCTSPGVCSCQEGFRGKSCDQAICKEGCKYGHCTNPGECHCTPGHSGDLCDQPVCEGGCGHGTCTNPGECRCQEGFRGKSCDEAICKEGCKYGRCTNPGECHCTPGHSGDLCDQPVCEGGCGHGTCTNPGECSCQEGFRGKNCDEAICKEGCKYGRCTNPGECHCTPGYSGDLCDQPVCGGGCGHGTCKSPGVCNCEGGYTGRNCEQVICKDGCIHGNCSKPDECLCYHGYSGTLCEKVYDVCSVPDFCANGGSCTPLGGVGQFECSCPMGYTGERCQDLVDNCVSGVCLNGGECINALNSFSCHCAPGFTGELCDVNINECASNPCHNRGTCVDKVSDYECVCPDTVDGTSPSKNCSGPPCTYVFCGENRTCTNVGDKAVCECPSGSTGQFCEGPPPNSDGSHTKCLLSLFFTVALAIVVVSSVCLLLWKKVIPTCEYGAITKSKKRIRKFFSKGSSRAKDADKCPLAEDREEYGSEEGLSEDDKQFLIKPEDSRV